MRKEGFAVLVLVLLLGQEAWTLQTSLPTNAVLQFDMLVSLANQVSHMHQQMDSSTHSNTINLGDMLQGLPHHNQSQLVAELGPTLIQLGLSSLHHGSQVQQAIHQAQQYVDANHTPVTLLANCLNGDSMCDMQSVMTSVISHFTNHFNQSIVQVDPSHMHPGRPIPVAYTRQQSLYLLTLKCLFWMAMAAVHFFHIHYIRKQVGLLQTNRNAARTVELEKRRNILERWQVIHAVFSTAKEWVDVNKADPKFQSHIEELCDMSEKKEAVADDNLEVDECWERMKGEVAVDPNTEILMQKSKIVIPETLVAFFAFAILLSNGAVAEHCDEIENRQMTRAYYCSNGAFQNSICVLTCLSGTFQDVQTMSILDPSQSSIMTCGTSGKWIGGPFECLRIDTTNYDPNVPMLTSASTR